MKDARIEKLADVLVNFSMDIQPQEKVAIKGPYIAEPLILALYQRCLERGAYPMIRAEIPQAAPMFYRFAQEHQLEHVWETDRWLIENLDVQCSIIADSNTRQLSRTDPAQRAIASRARKDLTQTSMNRTAAGDYRWCVTLFPTEAHAMDADMSLAEYEDFYFGACHVDKDDPVAEWTAMGERNQRLADWLEGRKEVHIEGEGTDLYLGIEGRTFVPSSGAMNFPDGEVFTGPIETATQGEVSFSFPAIYGGQAVEGIRLKFKDGKVVEAAADRKQDFLVETLDTDPQARILGELGIGTNYGIQEFSGETLLDEKIGGTIHLALGASYPETGGTNESAIHWDMVCDLRRGGRITVDGDLMMEDGKLLV